MLNEHRASTKIVKVGQSSKSSLFAIPVTLAGVGSMLIVFILALNASLPGFSSSIVQNPFGSGHEIKKFSSYADMVSFLSRAQAFNAKSYDNFHAPGPLSAIGSAVTAAPTYNAPAIMQQMPSASYGSAVGAAASSPPPASAPAAATSFSATNLQVAGVDEPDFMKNDGKYVYILSGDRLTIVDGYPAKNATIISRVALDVPPGQPAQDMFLNGGKLVIFYQSQQANGVSRSAGINAPAMIYPPIQVQYTHTHMLVVNISDRENPRVESNFDVTGGYSAARMIGSQVFLLTVDQVMDYQHPVQPSVQEQRSGAATSAAVYYFDDQQQNFAFNTVSVMDLNKVGSTGNKTGIIASKSFMIGSGATVYVSGDAMYMAYQLGSTFPVRFVPGVAGGPAFPGPIDYSDSTIIHRISISANSLLEYSGRAQVPGHLLNQFSMGEQGGRFIVATTSNGGPAQQNNVYTFDRKMNLVGKLEGIQQGESIFSARFMGDKLYLVTFQQLDPFLVIDISHDQPVILGKLELPGFSDYLQPYDATHVIGIGRDAVPSTVEPGMARPTGMKVALFDVADVHNPKVVGSYSFGDSQTYSEALNDHRAVLLDNDRNILVIPVSSVVGPDGGYGTWSGFYVFGTSTSEGIVLKGTIQHTQDTGNYYYGSQSARSFFINETLYTVTQAMMKMNDLADISHEINSLQLSGSGGVVSALR